MTMILIVDDTASNAKLARTVLESAGYRCLEANDGQSGIDLAQRERPDLVLMDVRLPGMSGIDATRKLKTGAATRSIPVIALTAHALKDERDAILAAGCDGYLAKPYRVDDLLQAVKRALAARPDSSPRSAPRSRARARR